VLSALALALACDPPAPPAEKPSPKGPVLDDRSLTSLMRDPPGKTRVVNFWATWCQPCVTEIPMFGRVASNHPGIDVVLVNVDLPARRPAALAFAEKHGAAPARVLLFSSPDPAGALPRLFPGFPDLLPVTWLIAADGTVRKRWAGAISEEELVSNL
jgi:thiol-disulfide isomerase/thioredoxin